jgi:hypothetical protein
MVYKGGIGSYISCKLKFVIACSENACDLVDCTSNLASKITDMENKPNLYSMCVKIAVDQLVKLLYSTFTRLTWSVVSYRLQTLNNAITVLFK